MQSEETNTKAWRRERAADWATGELTERLRQLAAAVFILQGYASRDDKQGPKIYGSLADNLYVVWKKHAATFEPQGNIADDVARELGYGAMAVCYLDRDRKEQRAYCAAARVVSEMLDSWHQDY